MLTLRSAEHDRRGTSPHEWVEQRVRARSRGDLTDVVVADCMARMRARMKIARRQAAHDDADYDESGRDVFSFSSLTPGPDAVSVSGGVRPHLDDGRAVFPSTRFEPPATGSRPPHLPGGREAFGRSALLNQRIASHESGHCVVGLALGSRITMITIIPNGEFSGRCVRAGPPSERFPEAGADGLPKTVAQITELCSSLAALPQPFGESRIDLAEGVVRMTNSVIELLSGREGERYFFADLQPLNNESDLAEATALASAIAVTPRAVGSLLRYAEAEAVGLIEQNADLVLALADALVLRGTLHADDIAGIVADTVEARSQNAEHEFA